MAVFIILGSREERGLYIMAKIARLNRLPDSEKKDYYSLLIPPSLFTRFTIDPETWQNPLGEKCITLDAPAEGAEASVSVASTYSDRDPAYYLEVSDTMDLVRLSWDFVMINDPDAPRFHTDLTPQGGDRWLNWRTRNQTEELMALSSGLAPGQVRIGMGLSREVNACLDKFCRTVGFASIFLEALYYHTAIIYERHGFRYFEGEPMMRKIHAEFQPGGALFRRLTGTPFRKAHFANSARGRSWAIHSGILDDAAIEGCDVWDPPKMYRMVDKRYEVRTAPDTFY